MKKRIQLSDHFTYGRLIRFVLPSIMMMIFTSIYGAIDGLFVSQFAGKEAFTAVNLIMPFAMLPGAFGFMLGTGGSAVVAKTLGEGKKERANEYFSMMVYTSIVGGIVLTVAGILTVPLAARAFGARDGMLDACVVYGRILFAALPLFILQNIFQSFLVTAEKPSFGLAVTVAAGFTNVVLDYLFVAVFQWGIEGAGIATGISQAVGAVIPLVYFIRKNDSLLHLTRPVFYGRTLWKACLNGSSELMTNISMSLVNILYNYQLMRFIGEDGVAAYGVIMYVNFFFVAVFIGYSIGTAPIVSFHYGAGNQKELRGIFSKSNVLMVGCGLAMVLLALGLSGPLAHVFVGYDVALMELTRHGFAIYSLSFAVMGMNIYGSAFFTALGDGLVSALISFLRTLVFQLASVLVLPVFFKADGIWMAVVISEVLALSVTVMLLFKKRSTYHYF
ncbi:MAG: MATE family efflux transporter [Lachnospiraceae bacterium]|jgi:putative MATE family efflux protein|nr:MATE family efflux transporter [Lachnospiraceae bacterium]